MSEALFSSAFADTMVAMALTDIDKRMVRVNNAFAKLFGYQPEAMHALVLTDLTHPEAGAETQCRCEGLLAGQDSHFQMETRYLHKDGQPFWGITNVSLVRSADGVPLQYVGQVQDITERKRAEQAIVRYNQYRKLLQQIDRALLVGEARRRSLQPLCRTCGNCWASAAPS